MAARRALAVVIAVLLAAPAGARELEEEPVYRWRLDGFVGFVVGLFFPNRGEGLQLIEPRVAGERTGAPRAGEAGGRVAP
jgi:hypothetical protein